MHPLASGLNLPYFSSWKKKNLERMLLAYKHMCNSLFPLVFALNPLKIRLMRKTTGIRQGLMDGGLPPRPDGELRYSHTFPATSEAKNAALDQSLEILAKAGVEGGWLRLVLDEALTNAVMHGSKFNEQLMVQIQVFVSATDWYAVIADQGPGFKEEDLPDPQAEENLLEESGRGVILMRNYMDVVRFYKSGSITFLKRSLTRKDA